MGSFLEMLNDYISYIQVTTVHYGLNIAQDIILLVLNQIPFVFNCIPYSTTEYHRMLSLSFVSYNCAHPCEEHPPTIVIFVQLNLVGPK